VRRRRVGIAAGALAVLLVGGAGTAYATGGFTWAPWAQHPVGAVPFTMSNGFECELRFSGYTDGTDPGFLDEVNHTLEEWYASTDVVAAAERLVPAKRIEVEKLRAEEPVDPEADITVLSPEEQAKELVHREWVNERLVWDLAISDLEAQALRDAGIAVLDPRFEGSSRQGQIQCYDENHELYVPGDGS